MIEAARAEIQAHKKRSFWSRAARSWSSKNCCLPHGHATCRRGFISCIKSPVLQTSRPRKRDFEAVPSSWRIWRRFRPNAEIPFFFPRWGKHFRLIGERRYRVAFLAGCIANIALLA